MGATIMGATIIGTTILGATIIQTTIMGAIQPWGYNQRGGKMGQLVRSPGLATERQGTSSTEHNWNLLW